jgi:hypothetical protein
LNFERTGAHGRASAKHRRTRRLRAGQLTDLHAERRGRRRRSGGAHHRTRVAGLDRHGLPAGGAAQFGRLVLQIGDLRFELPVGRELRVQPRSLDLQLLNRLFFKRYEFGNDALDVKPAANAGG